MTWRARTLEDALKDIPLGGRGNVPDMKRVRDEELPETMRLKRHERMKGRTDYACPGCNITVQAFRLADVSSLPPRITGGVAFACDGCRTKWARQGKMDIDELAEALGAPRQHVERIREWKAARRTVGKTRGRA